jgi:HAD superfamily hydrolase (TIGR01509 family)
LDACLKRLGIFDWFDNVWSCNDFGTTKADPNIYRAVAERLDEPIENILFLDDNLDADQTAKSAGMTVCGVYDASSEEYTEQIKAVTDFYITDFTQLL